MSRLVGSLEIIGSAGKTPSASPGYLVVVGGQRVHLTLGQFETLLISLAAAAKHPDQEICVESLAKGANIEPDSFYRRLHVLARELDPLRRIAPPNLEPIGHGCWRFNVPIEQVKLDRSRLDGHVSAIVRAAAAAIGEFQQSKQVDGGTGPRKSDGTERFQ